MKFVLWITEDLQNHSVAHQNFPYKTVSFSLQQTTFKYTFLVQFTLLIKCPFYLILNFLYRLTADATMNPTVGKMWGYVQSTAQTSFNAKCTRQNASTLVTLPRTWRIVTPLTIRRTQYRNITSSKAACTCTNALRKPQYFTVNYKSSPKMTRLYSLWQKYLNISFRSSILC